MNKKFLDTIEYSISDKNILLRTDYNVPIKDDVIINDDELKNLYQLLIYYGKRE